MAASYFIGSIPVAWLIAKLVTGQDLRRMGSGNVGVMNGATFSLVFLSTHRPETDDHLLVKARWPNLRAFLTAPRRK